MRNRWAGEHEHAKHGKDIDVEEKQQQNGEDLREGELDCLGVFLHDAGRQEEEEWSEKPPNTYGVAQGVFEVRGSWAKGERDNEIHKRHYDHDCIQHEPRLFNKTSPAQKTELHHAVYEEDEEANNLYALSHTTRRLTHVPECGVRTEINRGEAEGSGILKKCEDEVEKDHYPDGPLDVPRVVDTIQLQRPGINLMVDRAIVDAILNKYGALKNGRVLILPIYWETVNAE